MHGKPRGHEIFKNFEFLGRSGVFEFENGFRIAFLSGKDNDLYENASIVSNILIKIRLRKRKIKRGRLNTQEIISQRKMLTKFFKIIKI